MGYGQGSPVCPFALHPPALESSSHGPRSRFGPPAEITLCRGVQAVRDVGMRMSEHSKITTAELAKILIDARARTLALVSDLTDEQLMGPRLPIVNPLLWEIGHVAWFQEKWVLRYRGKQKPIREDGDALYDSARVPHDSRWDLPLPSRDETLAYMQQVMNRIIERLG